jgi:hypothetical protein
LKKITILGSMGTTFSFLSMAIAKMFLSKFEMKISSSHESGILILVAHDRDFLNCLATKVFEFGNKRVKEYFEDIAGFLAHKKIENFREIEK